jgi:hypothetical protein
MTLPRTITSMHTGDGRKIGQFSGVDRAPQQTPTRGWGVPNVQNSELFCGVFLTGFLDSVLRRAGNNLESCYEIGSKFDNN